ncbi:MAG TPA: response regulator transcription factor [Blastococcus sp.]|jgi:DNA-binding NarL/FixJ family response regulator
MHDAGSGPREIRVLVVDDHALVRAALVESLSDEADLTVVGECEDGSEVVASAARLLPDVVVMDRSMPVMDGLTATQALRATLPEPRVVMHTASGPEVRMQAAVAGAHALVPKGIRMEELQACLRAVVAGCGCCPYCL